MLNKSNSKTSFHSFDNKTIKINKIEPVKHVQQIQNSLQEASKLLSHEQFTAIFEKIIKNLIRKAEVQSPNSQIIYLQAVKSSLLVYGGSLQLNVRALLLEILSGMNARMLQDIPSKLNKAKHIVLQTHIQYLLSKIFLLQVKYFVILDDESSALKSLKKCLELNQEHMVEFMQESEEIRKQIVDYALIAYYEIFKIKKAYKPSQALQNLLKACSIAKRNYGHSHKIYKGIQQLYNNQESLLNSLERMSAKSRAITDILDYQNKKNYRTTAFFSWEDQKIVVQFIKIKNKERQVISEASYDIKLDMNKIRLLQNNQWLSVSKEGQIVINEDELMRIIGTNNNESNNKQMTTGIELKNLSKQEIIKKTYVSSSEDDQQLCLSKINLFKQPRAQSSRKFKQTQ